MLYNKVASVNVSLNLDADGDTDTTHTCLPSATKTHNVDFVIIELYIFLIPIRDTKYSKWQDRLNNQLMIAK